MSSISFDNIYLLLIAIPLALFFAVPFCVAVRKDNRNGHNVASLAIHLLMAVIIAFAAAGTQIITVTTKTEVVVVADLSYSTDKNLDKIDRQIKNIKLPQGGRLGVVCFGADCQELVKIGSRLKSVKEATVDRTESNITEAMRFAKERFSENSIKRMVLITDGKQTYDDDTNAIKREADLLRSENIYLDAVYLDSNINYETEKEVQISSVEFTKSAYLGGENFAKVTVRSSYQTNATIILFKDGQEFDKRMPRLSDGVNTFNFALDSENAGVHEYKLTIEADGDGLAQNNEYSFTQTLNGEMKVLALVGETDFTADLTSLASLYGEKYSLEVYADCRIPAEAEQIVKDKPNIKLNGKGEDGVWSVPFSVEALCGYDQIILCNADATKVANSQAFVENLDKAVSVCGKSLMTFGNTNIQDKTDGSLKNLDDMLPVRFSNADTDKKLYSIVIDSSRSMEQLEHFTMAKQATKHILGLLNPVDDVCIVTFNGTASPLEGVPIVNNVGEYRDRLYTVIDELEARQGTSIGSGMQEALDNLKNRDGYAQKQVMLITDGLNYTFDEYDVVKISADMRAEDIYTSVIDVGRKGDNEEGVNTDPAAIAAKQLLNDITVTGGGKYFHTPSPNSLNELLFSDISSDVTQSVIEGVEAEVKTVKRFDTAVAGIEGALPQISGYVISRPKLSANTVLNLVHNKNGSEREIPLYAYWEYGNGKVSSFTGGFKNLDKWREGGTFEKFFKNVIGQTTPLEKTDYPYTLEFSLEGKKASLNITPVTYRYDAAARVEITSPDGTKTQGNLVNYGYSFATPQVGRYGVKVIYSYGGKDYTAEMGFYLSYSPEYDRFAVFDAYSLNKAVGADGKVIEDGVLEITNDEKNIGIFVVDLTLPLLIVCAVLFIIDVVVRKLKWADIVSLFGFGKKTEKKDGGDGDEKA